jgi:hypothetical protein
MSAPTQTSDGYAFEGGFPTPATVRRPYDAADLNRAVQACRFFFPTVSGLAIFKGNAAVGVVPNRVFARFATEPEQMGFTLNSDTPYGPILLDLRDGPMVIELPPWPADLCRVRPEPAVGGRHGRRRRRRARGAVVRPSGPEGAEGRWIKTIPGRGWFVYVRIYGPEQPAFEGSWRLPDFEVA